MLLNRFMTAESAASWSRAPTLAHDAGERVRRACSFPVGGMLIWCNCLHSHPRSSCFVSALRCVSCCSCRPVLYTLPFTPRACSQAGFWRICFFAATIRCGPGRQVTLCHFATWLTLALSEPYKRCEHSKRGL